MGNVWSLYQAHPSFVLGFHGTEKATAHELVSGNTRHLKQSVGAYEWLGHGTYFWENDPQRAQEWAESGHAKTRIKTPGVVGAVIDLGLCLDLTTRIGLDEVLAAYNMLKGSYEAAGKALPSNRGTTDLLRRELDCQVIEALHVYRRCEGQADYDTVRAPFLEGSALYENAGFRRHNHIQIAVRNPRCIRGYFHPIKDS